MDAFLTGGLQRFFVFERGCSPAKKLQDDCARAERQVRERNIGEEPGGRAGCSLRRSDGFPKPLDQAWASNSLRDESRGRIEVSLGAKRAQVAVDFIRNAGGAVLRRRIAGAGASSGRSFLSGVIKR